MNKRELIEALERLDCPDDAKVYVWESYDAGCMTTDIDIRIDDGDIILER